FSHHRVTVPPPGWTTAAHRQGVKMLGTLIFEHDQAKPDCLRLLVGQLPKSPTGTASTTQSSLTSSLSLPLSTHYPRLLAQLAAQRGFDGYLLNFECPLLQGGTEQTRVLAAWITLLKKELRDKVGMHAEVVWYDSVIFTGHLAWQDRLNSLNLPFFLSSDSIFTNYTWRPTYPNLTAQYFLSLSSALTANKTLRDIYMGIDVWGRGSHGAGSFGSYRALHHISPSSLGLSVAIFGQAWSWESEQDKDEWTWEKWWDYERLLWAGPRTDEEETIPIPEMPRPEGTLPCECTSAPYKAISTFFPRKVPPNPAKGIPFHTTFCPGVGRGWWVDGRKVYDKFRGWTDVHKQTSMGDLLWPSP
ncbi:glycoside hydrolase, partial [Dendrothele bispora CBS 962.96]